MWLILQQEEAEDYVIATGKNYSVREFLSAVFSRLDLDWEEYVETDPRYLRPTEVDVLLGNPEKAMKKLGWRPKVDFDRLVEMMIESDMELAQQEKTLREAGHLPNTRCVD
jgi:GDPmannose 4,6-dehydratase